jgi:hypothetical protein
MKLRDVGFPLHGTSVAFTRTHPVPVCRIFFPFGVGTVGTLREGGENTDVIRRPTKSPINIQKRENILICLTRF